MSKSKKNKSDDFNYVYTAPTNEERKEIENIKNSYIKKEDNFEQTKISRLRSLDLKVKNTPGMVGLIIGVIGLLIFGTGLSIILELKFLPFWLGIIVSIAGAITMTIAYPITKLITKKLKSKYTQEIIKLSEELLNEKQTIEFKD